MIKINENALYNLVYETLNTLLNEGRNADKAKAKTFEVIKDYFNNASWLNDVFNSPDANPNNLTTIEYIENKLKEWLFHANISDAIIRLEPIMMNIALSLGFEQGNENSSKLNRLKLIMDYIIANYKNSDFPIQLNKLTLENTTYESLNKMFGEIIDELIAQDHDDANSYDENSTMNPNYDVIEVKDFKTAEYYGSYSCSYSQLCYTNSKHTWNQYTNNGKNRVYLILNKDWKNIPEEHGDGTPYDDYGLSMIFLFIDEYGDIAYSNTRWNHETDGQGPSNVDQSFTKSMISKLLGINFDSVFKPYTNDEFMLEIKSIEKRLQYGDDINDIFDEVFKIMSNCYVVSKNYKWNVILNRQILSETWFDNINSHVGSLFRVVRNNRANVLNMNGELISPNQWFDNVYFFNENYIQVFLNNKFNIFKSNGELLSPNQWFDDASYYNDDFFIVRKKNLYNLLSLNGKILNDNIWYNWIYNAYDGYARVQKNDKYNVINTDNGELLYKSDWFDEISDLEEDFFIVSKDGKENYINTQGELLSPNQWFDEAEVFDNGFGKVLINKKYNLISNKGNFISPKLWFDNIDDFFYNGFIKVKLNKKYNLLNQNGHFINNDMWFDSIKYLIDGFTKVKIDNKYNLINQSGEILSPDLWFDDIKFTSLNSYFIDDLAEVKLNNKYNLLNKSGEIISPNQWFDYINILSPDKIEVAINNKYFFITPSGKLIENKRFLPKKIKINENKLKLLF